MVFELFDAKAEYVVHDGANLPHWYQPGVTYFVTFRTDDSIPAEVGRQWRRRRDVWLQQHGIDAAVTGWRRNLTELPREAQREFHDTFSQQFLEDLDRGLGVCPFREPELARIVADSLLHFDGERYLMGDFVVMPNHVHLLVCLLEETPIEAQCQSWKHFTATKINRRLTRRGRFWQEESFDHLVRTPDQFEAIRHYIASNPKKAHLKPGAYLHRRREQER